MLDNHQKNIATLIHLSTFSRFIIPFGNLLGPVILWATNKDKSEFIDAHGKQAINFQLSILLYVIIIGTLTIPFLIFNLFSGIDFMHFNEIFDFHINFKKPAPIFYIVGGFSVIAIFGFLLELAFIIKASLKARDGEYYKYPFTINFLK
jgi:uncharacterized Tic20 family protein